jgi:dCMP deaminase
MSTTRISWDDYFMQVAHLISCRSPCERLRVGCVIVSNHRIVSAGYNGFLAGVPHQSIVRDGHEQATVHAEQNAIADCAERGVCTRDATCYVTHYPCLNCAKIMAAAGIRVIQYKDNYRNDPLVKPLLASVQIAVIQTPGVLDSTNDPPSATVPSGEDLLFNTV